jgi:tetratricopeptide (TPR) repeat protein
VPTSGKIYRALGESYASSNDTTRALRAFKRAMRVEPHDLRAYQSGAGLQQRRGKDGAALKMLSKAAAQLLSSKRSLLLEGDDLQAQVPLRPPTLPVRVAVQVECILLTPET